MENDTILNLFQQFRNNKSLLEEDLKTSDENQQKLEEMAEALEELRTHESDLIQNYNEETNSQSVSKIEELNQEKNEALDKKSQLIQNINQLRKEIREMEPDTNITNLQKSLTIFESIVPIKFTNISATRISGIISYGYSDSTEEFDFNTKMDGIPDQFWTKVQKLYQDSPQMQKQE